MKTLYININGKNVVSNDEIVVVGTEKDNIVNKFYIALAKVISEGVAISKKKPLIKEFENDKPQDFKTILEQWDEVRYRLLSNKPSGIFNVKIPNTYLEWLQYHQNSEYRKIYTQKYSKQKEIFVSLEISQLYEETIELIISNIDPDDYNKLVVNDDFVTRESAIVQSIKNEYPKIAFVQFEEFKWPKENFGDKHGDGDEVCPICGKSPCECNTNSEIRDILLVAYDEDKDNEYIDSDDEPKHVKVFQLSNSPKLIHEGKYEKPLLIPEQENGHDVLDLKRWDDNIYDEISVAGIRKSLDWSRTVRCKNYNKNNNDKYEGSNYEPLGNYYLINRCYSDDCVIDVLDRKTKKILLKKVWDNNGIWVCKDWCIVAGADWENRAEEIRTLFNNEHKIRLKPWEDILDPSDRYSNIEKDAFITENRIISYILKDGENTVIPECMEEINIRDYNGILIKTIRHPNILIKCAYKYGKALGFKVDGDTPTALIYLDLYGKIHDIPFSVDYIDNAYEAKCKFVSADSIYIDYYKAEDEDRYKLIDLQGNILFDPGEGMLRYIGDDLIEYYDYYKGKNGVMDGHGRIILNPQFDQIWGVLE